MNANRRLEKATINWTTKQIATMIKNGRISFDHIVQRSYLWNKDKGTLLIDSIILGYPIPQVYAKRGDATDENGKNSKVYLVLDGQQRLTTIGKFLNDEMELGTINPVVYYDEELNCEVETDISGMKFSELPTAIADIVKDSSVSVVYYDEMTEEQEISMFVRLNNGQPMSGKSRLVASCNNIRGILELGKHKLFEEMLSPKARANKAEVSIIMKMWAMLNMKVEEISFASKDFQKLCEATEISAVEEEELISVFDYITDLHEGLMNIDKKKIAKKLYTETHLVSLVPFIRDAMENDYEFDSVVEWISKFFDSENGTSNSDEYNACSGSGVAKNVNIVGRYNALKKSFIDVVVLEEHEELSPIIEEDEEEEDMLMEELEESIAEYENEMESLAS